MCYVGHLILPSSHLSPYSPSYIFNHYMIIGFLKFNNFYNTYQTTYFVLPSLTCIPSSLDSNFVNSSDTITFLNSDICPSLLQEYWEHLDVYNILFYWAVLIKLVLSLTISGNWQELDIASMLMLLS